jgi:hypothetical protein
MVYTNIYIYIYIYAKEVKKIRNLYKRVGRNSYFMGHVPTGTRYTEDLTSYVSLVQVVKLLLLQFHPLSISH